MTQVLLLSRDADLRQLLRDFLSASGYHVVEVTTDQEAAELISESAVDVVVTEVSRLSAILNDQTPSIPVLALAEMDDDRLPQLVSVRMLTKPASLHAISAALGELVDL